MCPVLYFILYDVRILIILFFYTLPFKKQPRTPAQKISDATKKKEEGNDQFKKGSFKLALFSYQKVHISVLDSLVPHQRPLDQKHYRPFHDAAGQGRYLGYMGVHDNGADRVTKPGDRPGHQHRCVPFKARGMECCCEGVS